MRDKVFEIASDPKYHGCQRGLASIIYTFFDKKCIGRSVATSNYQLANELHKQIIKKLKRKNLYSSFKDNIWGIDLAEMQSLSKTD